MRSRNVQLAKGIQTTVETVRILSGHPWPPMIVNELNHARYIVITFGAPALLLRNHIGLDVAVLGFPCDVNHCLLRISQALWVLWYVSRSNAQKIGDGLPIRRRSYCFFLFKRTWKMLENPFNHTPTLPSSILICRAEMDAQIDASVDYLLSCV